MDIKNYGKVFILGIIAITLCAGVWSQGKQPDANVAEQIVQIINEIPGSHFETKLEDSIVEPVSRDRYRVVFKNSFVTLNWLSMAKILSKKPFSSWDTKNPIIKINRARIDEMVILYTPKEKNGTLESLKGLSIEGDFSTAIGTGQKNKPDNYTVNKVNLSIAKATFKNNNIRHLLENKAQVFESRLENLKLEVNLINGANENKTILIETKGIGDIKAKDKTRELYDYIYKKDSPKPDIRGILQTGTPLHNLKIRQDKLNISIRKKDKKWVDVSIGSLFFSILFTPNKERTHFEIDYALGIKNFKLSNPEKKEISFLTHVEDLLCKLSIKHFSPELFMALFDYQKKNAELEKVAPGSNMRENMGMELMKLFSAFMSSKVSIEASISPFKHCFGELTANLYIMQVLPPAAELRIDISKTNDILKKIEETGICSSTTLQQISQTLEQLTVKKENGDASITIQLKPDHMGAVFINGKKVNIPLNIFDLSLSCFD